MKVGKGSSEKAVYNTDHPASISESAATLYLLRLGFQVLIPWGKEKYDMVAHWKLSSGEDCFEKIQVKTGRVVNEGRAVQSNWNQKYREGDWDSLCVYCKEVNALYFIPWEHLSPGKSNVKLWLEPIRQKTRVLMAENYDITNLDLYDMFHLFHKTAIGKNETLNKLRELQSSVK
jgi:hypothetical protein